MKIGVCTWTFGNQDLATTATILAELGLDGVELLGDLDLYTAKEALHILNDKGLEVFSLTPANVDIAHPDNKIRQAALDYYFRLIEFASALGNPFISCHGLVGRIAPLTSMAEENDLLVEAVQQIAQRAQQTNLRVVFEVLNRYETHQIHNHSQALELVEQVGLTNLGILLDAYHMNIEETEPNQAIVNTGKNLWLYHAADSNRGGVGYGHTNFDTQLLALGQINYEGALILECTAPGPNPFTPDKGGKWRDVLQQSIRDSLDWLTMHS